MNASIFVGIIARDEWRLNGKVARNALVVRRNGPKRDGEPDVDFVPITLLGEQRVEFAQKYLPKGKWVSVNASYRTFEYEKDGETIHGHEFIVNEINFCGAKVDSGDADGGGSANAGRPSSNAGDSNRGSSRPNNSGARSGSGSSYSGRSNSNAGRSGASGNDDDVPF